MKTCLAFICACLAGVTLLRGAESVVISEFMASNARMLADEDGDFSDWIELFNADTAPVDLAGWSLTDDPAVLKKWTFPSVVLPPGGYLVVFASGKNRIADPARLHTNFQLDGNGEFLALVKPDGVTLAQAYTPSYPAQKEDMAFGLAQNTLTTALLADTAPRLLVPTSAGSLAANWNAVDFEPDDTWQNVLAPPAIGYDTNQPISTLANLARGGTAVQSTTTGTNSANLAINGNLNDFTATLNTDNAPFWQLTLAEDATLYQIVLRNRTSCCGSRLRDIIVEILAADGMTTNFVSPLLNPENQGYTYPEGPAVLSLNLTALAGGSVLGKIVRVRRVPDPDLSGSGSQGGSDEAFILSLGEVEVYGAVSSSTEVNLARTGTPAPTATQSSEYNNGQFPASLAINGNTGDFSHTLNTDPNPTWRLNLGRRSLIRSVVMYNRTSCCQLRLRDITVQILDTDTNVVLYTSTLLNPGNVLNSPMTLTLDLEATPVVGQYVVIRRTPDPNLSGTADDKSVLSLGEVMVMGSDLTSYRPFIRTDVESQMLGVNASAFVRVPFTVDDPSMLTSLSLQLRYDDGFIAYLNGTKVAERNAPPAPAWNSTATANRDIASGLMPETIALNAALPWLQPGTNVLGIQAMNSSAGDADFLLQAELFSTYRVTTANVYLADPTPGTNNESVYYYGDVADTQFSVQRGFFDTPFSLEITCDTPEAQIWYSFDCSEPRPGVGMLYTGPITIANSTVVRARAFKAGLRPTDIDTQTYLFLGDVIYQATNGQAPPYFPASWGRNRVDYGMDPLVIAQYSPAEWREALTQIPTMSIVTEMKNLFDPATGIYANADGHGEDWERPSSIELLDPESEVPGRFQEPCGLRIRGGYSRNADFVKHSLRVFFRREYGAPRLHYPLFEDEGATEFDTFDLRTSQNYAWPRETSAANGTNDTMVREVFCRETLGAMGQPYRRSRYYHLYLNGQYWGLYETDERPEASYGEIYFGGDKEDYDVVKCANHVGAFVTEVTDGNFAAWSNLWVMALSLRTNNAGNSNYFRILGCNPDGTRNPALPVMIDVDNLIDYMLGIFYSGDGDATLSAFLSNTRPNNWFGMKNRNNPDMGFRFFNSDCEHTLGAPSWQADRTGPWGDISGSNIGNFTYSNPQYMHEELMLNAEYRLRFADHVQRHFFNDGPLTPQSGTNRFLRKAAQITKAMRAYEARWGDANASRVRYNTMQWTNTINHIVRTWFPGRTATVLAQLKADGLYPSLAAPNFNQLGGEVPAGYALLMSQTNAAGVIYYTLDGSDPRLVDGVINGTAQAYASAVTIEDNVRVKARVFNAGQWSALTEADFAVSGAIALRVTEIMYHPAPLSAAEVAAGFANAEDFEFIELRNVGSRPIALAGISFVNGITFAFNSGILAAGERVLLVKSLDAFNFRYGPATNIAGNFAGNLNNAGERLRLQDALGRAILDFSYGDNWAPLTDGHGFSLTIVDDQAPAATWDKRSSWRTSSSANGSPGQPNPPPPLLPFVVINELLSRPLPGGQVSVELANVGDGPADVSGWWLSDNLDMPYKFRLPTNTVIQAGEFKVFTEDDFGLAALGTNALTFSPSGGEARLFSAGANGELTGYYHGWDFGTAEPGVSFGRHVVSTGGDQFVAQSAVTLGSANAGPLVGPIVITELMYRPPDLGTNDNSADEFVELLNLTANEVPLFDATQPTNTWKVTGGVDFVFPTNTTIAAGEFVLLVNFDPQANPQTAADFRLLYGIPENVRLFGPYSGKLANSGEAVELKKPTILPLDVPAYVLVERVNYSDSSPWPAGADGYGLSLQRRTPAAYGNDPANWVAVYPSAAATPNLTGEPPTLSQQPSSQVLGLGRNAVLSVAASGSEPLRYQWRFNNVNLDGATNATLDLGPAQLDQAGQYEVMVGNNVGSVVSDPATLVVRTPPTILTQPASVTVRVRPDSLAAPTTNATFSIKATSASLVDYQWYFNGEPIPGATNESHTVVNVQTNDWGQFRAAATDEFGTTLSDSVWLNPLVRPGFVQGPLAQTVVPGSLVSLSAIATGWPPPFTFEWRTVGYGLATNTQPISASFFNLKMPNYPTNYTLRATIKNLALPSGIGSGPFVTVSSSLPDADGDGMPDAWENAYGFNPTNEVDRTLDADADGISNGNEYLSGTNPTNALSYLRVSSLQGEAGAMRLEFYASSNLTYTVLQKTTLADENWSRLASVAARGSNRVETVIDPSPDALSRYYRLVTPAQP